MDPPPSIDRRRFVALSGTALAAVLSGCGMPGDGGAGTTQPATSPDGGTTAPGDQTTAETETTEGTETTTAQQGFLRAAHASPDAPDVDVFVNDQLAFEAVPFGDVTSYVQLPPADYDLRVTAAGDPETVVFEASVPVDAGFQTAVAYGELGAEEGAETAFAVDLLADSSDQSGGDEARVRLFHGSPDAPAVDVTVAGSGDVLFDGVAFGDATEYAAVPPGTYTLEVRPDTGDGTGDVAASFDVTVEGGTAYSAFAVGYLDASGDRPGFDLVTATDSRDRQPT